MLKKDLGNGTRMTRIERIRRILDRLCKNVQKRFIAENLRPIAAVTPQA
jgi:hypothetical protein